MGLERFQSAGTALAYFLALGDASARTARFQRICAV